MRAFFAVDCVVFAVNEVANLRGSFVIGYWIMELRIIYFNTQSTYFYFLFAVNVFNEMANLRGSSVSGYWS